MADSGYQGKLKQKTSSMSVMPYILFVQKYCFEDPEAFVNLFIEELREEKNDVFRSEKLKDASVDKTMTFQQWVRDEMQKEESPELFKKIELERM